MKATKKSKYLNPAEYGGKGAKDLEGFLFPDTWEYKTKHPVSYLVRLQLQDFKKKIKKVEHEVREVEKPDRLRRGHDRLDDRTRGGRAEAAQAGRLGDLQPPARRDDAGDRLDDPLRHRQLRKAADPVANWKAIRRTTRAPTRACRRGRSTAPGWKRSRPPRTRRRPTTSSTSTIRTRATNSPSRRPKKNSSPTQPSTKRRAKRTAATSRAPANEPGEVAVPNLAVIGHPVGALALAGDADGGADRDGAGGRVDLRGARRGAGGLRGRSRRAGRGGRVRRRERHRPAQGSGAGDGRRGERCRPRDRRRQHADLPRRPDRGGQHRRRRPAALAARASRRASGRALVLGAGGPRGRRSGRWRTAGGAARSGRGTRRRGRRRSRLRGPRLEPHGRAGARRSRRSSGRGPSPIPTPPTTR